MAVSLSVSSGQERSAASIISVLRGLGHYYRVDFRPEWYARYSLEVENMQHGRASGLDTFVSLHGGCVLFRQGESRELPLPRVPLYIVNTGHPASSTGEAVSSVARRTGGASAPIWDEFESATLAMEKASRENDLPAFQRAMRTNHRLLDAIGVVPPRVAEFVAEVEATGATAKVCGAGAVSGDAAGMVVVASETSPADLCARHGYELMTVRPDPLGVRIV